MTDVCPLGVPVKGQFVAMSPVTVHNPGYSAVTAKITDVNPAVAKGWLGVPAMPLLPGEDTTVPITLHVSQNSPDGAYVVNFKLSGVPETATWSVGYPQPSACPPLGGSSGPSAGLIFFLVLIILAIGVAVWVRRRLKGRIS